MFANTTHSGSGRGFALAASAFATFVLFPAFTVAAEDTIKRRDALDFGPGSLKSSLELVGFKRRSGSRKRASRAEEARRTEGESKSDTIGPWKIEAVFKGDMFDRCSINRTLKDDIVATFVRTGEGLSSRTPISELEARRRQALSGEDDAWAPHHRHRSRRQAELRLDRNQGREICGGASQRKRA